AALVWAPAFAPGPADEPTLEPGRRIERELGPGETHAYPIRCTAGAYLRVVVEQRGIDVLVMVSGPDGGEVLAVDTPSGRTCVETVPFVAERPGAYRVLVRGLENEPRGTYVAHVEEPQPATARNRTEVEARRLWGQADRLREQRTAEAFRRSLE